MSFKLATSLAMLGLAAPAAAQDLARIQPAPPAVHAGRYIVATQTFIPAGLERGGAGAEQPIYVNNALGASTYFYNLASIDYKIWDEGRVPSTTSTPIVGTQDSYTLSSLQLGYVTDELSVDFVVELFERYTPCSGNADNAVPIATLNLTGLPGTATAGTLSSITVDVVLPPGICMRADGDGTFDGANDTFGWSISTPNLGNTGPFIRAHPALAPEGDATVFSNPAAPMGTGLGTLSLFRRETGLGAIGCFFFGAYDPTDNNPPFASFHLVLRSELLGDCIGCGIGDDRFEENDDNMSPAPVIYGSYPGLVLEPEDDWFLAEIPAGAGMVAQVFFTHAVSDIDMRLFDANTGTQLASSGGVTDSETVAYINCDTQNALPVWIQVLNFDLVCTEYDLLINSDPLAGDDSLEDNDSCLTRIPLPLGSTSGLIVRPSCGATGGEDSDYYGVTLNPGQSLTVDLLFIDAIADIDLILYDSTAGCNGVTLDTGFTTTDNEYCVATNSGATPIDVTVRVDWFAGSSNSYEMIACVTDGPGLGGTICVGVTNSTGEGAVLCAEGSSVAADNDLTLRVIDLPLNSNGFFFTSQETNVVSMPGGSAGNICIASLTIGRYDASILNSGAAGEVELALDLGNTPQQPGGPVAVVAGETRYWQYWYRDMDPAGAATSNFSSALGVLFQ